MASTPSRSSPFLSLVGIIQVASESRSSLRVETEFRGEPGRSYRAHIRVFPFLFVLSRPKKLPTSNPDKKKLTINTFYMITIKHRLSIYTSMKHSLLSLKLLALALNSLTLSDIRIKAFTLLFELRRCLFQTQA
jgi:hypothetical protein